MFKCIKCEALADEVGALRKQVDKLQNLLAATVNYEAYRQVVEPKESNPADYYGNNLDEQIEYNEYGEKVISIRNEGSVQ